MFDSKQKSLIEKKEKTSVSTKQDGHNSFVQAGLKKAAKTLSGNGAEKFSTTGNDFVDQFGKLGAYKNPRPYNEVASEMATLWGSNPMWAVCMILYIRLITRVVQLFNGKKTEGVQRGAGLKHEGMLRMIWLHVNHKETFWKNIHLFISVGAWKDIIQMLSYDLQYNKWQGRMLDWDAFGKLILAGLENPSTTNLVKKYLPQIRANSYCHTIESQADNIIAKWICSLLYPIPTTGKLSDEKKESMKRASYKAYRKNKISGNAHSWQQLISQKKLLELNFDSIHGRALAQLVSSKFLKNQNLEKRYAEWIAKKPIAKFTGFVSELFVKAPSAKYQIDTLNAQFMGLVKTAKEGAVPATRFICVVDTSGSMSHQNSGIKMSNENVAKSLALFFHYMLDKGPLANVWYEFSDYARLHEHKGSTPYEKWQEMLKHSITSDTNFQAVVDHMIEMKRQNPEIPESDLPNGFLVMSDGEFNSVLGGINTKQAIKKMEHFFSREFMAEFKFVFWNLASNAYGKNTGKKFESYGDLKNYFYLSGYDGSIIAFLTGSEIQDASKPPTTALELFKAAMEQEIMQYVEL